MQRKKKNAVHPSELKKKKSFESHLDLGHTDEYDNTVTLLKKTDYIWLIFFTIVSFYTRFYKLTTPSVVLFDEVHFGKFVNSHIDGHFYFDIHPPLVKLLMALLLVIFTDYKGDQPFLTIGEEFLPTTPIWLFRFIPALAGSLIVPVVYLITKRMNFSDFSSFLCTSMVCFDNLFLGESREILTDSCLILFICLAFFCHLSSERYHDQSKWWKIWTTLTGISLGCAISTKWTSLSVFGIVGISTLGDIVLRYIRNPSKEYLSFHLNGFGSRLVRLLGIPIFIYVTCFFFYFWTLPRSGPGDPFMKIPFQSTLIGSKVVWHGRTPSFSDNFWDLNFEMFRANKNVATPHHWQSYWYTWPFNYRGIACWNGNIRQIFVDGIRTQVQAFVYLLGNPFVWWFSTFCLFISPLLFLVKRNDKKQNDQKQTNTLLFIDSPTYIVREQFGYTMFKLYLGWISSMLPYALISRACFIYHYMPSLVFAILVTGVLIDTIFNSFKFPTFLKGLVVGFLVSLFVLIFWYYLPFSYADELTVAENQERRWFESWY